MLAKYYSYTEHLKKQNRFREISGSYSGFLLDHNLNVNTSGSFTPDLNFISNDYLGLSNDPELLNSAYIAAKEYGVGATGSRLLSGDRKIFIELEQQIAKDKGTEAALIFNTGFQANVSVLSSLLDLRVLEARPIVFFDKLNHASLYQAIFLSKVDLYRYRHNDIQHLSDLLTQFATINRPKFIVTETLFGMEGDLLPIKEIINLARKYNAFIYLDEAHATGVIGVEGYGLAAKLNFENINYLLMGTFSKAIGSSGGYIATNKIIADYLVNKSPGFIYSTALSPMIIGAVKKSWNLVKNFKEQRLALFENANYLRVNLKKIGFDTGNSNTHIIPVILGKEQLTLSYKQKLFNLGIIVAGIRPPTVPIGTSRLRIALNVRHTLDSLNLLLQAFKDLCVNV